MTATEYEMALKTKRTEILASIETARQQASEIAALISLKEAQLKNIDDLLLLESGSAPSQRATPPSAPDRKGSSFVDQAAEVLRELGRPAHYRQLVELLADRKVYVPGKDPGANLISHITRDDRFVRTGRGLYGLAEWPSVSAARPKSKRKRNTRKRKTTKRQGGSA
jgi:hypothetical protein